LQSKKEKEKMNKKQIINNQKRKGWFRFMKRLMLGRYKEPEFVFLGEKFSNSSIIISNHEGTDAPMSMELYCDKPIRFWGAHEMNSGLVSLYKYQTKIYYHEKKHWNIHLARLFCLIASPITNLFYKGLNLISTYKDARLVKTLRESMEALKQGDNIVVFPEDSKNGYLEQLEGFFAGFAMLAEVCYKRGMDVPIFVTYFRRKDLKYIIDAPIKYSELAKGGATRADIAKRLLDRCNELGRMTFDKSEKVEQKELKTATK
jgi:hypothetical protein